MKKDISANRPFAGSGHMVRNKLHWDANDAEGLSKQRKVGMDWYEFLCFGSPTALFASQCNIFRTMWLDPAKGLFVTERFDSLQQRSTKGATQYELESFLTMATYWVPDLPNIKGISSLLQRSIFKFANGASCVWSSRHINMLAPVCDPV